MRFAQIEGHDTALAALAGMVDSGKVPHAIMLSGEDGGDVFPVALAFLQYLYCSSASEGDSCGTCPSCNRISKMIHPDVHFIFPTASKMTSLSVIDKFRDLVLANPHFTERDLDQTLGVKNPMIAVSEAQWMLSTLSLSALEGGYRSMLVYLPEKMNADTSNRLLKVIEEPSDKTQFVFVTHAPEKVLPTIASRCQRIHIPGKGAPVTFDDPDMLPALMDCLLSRDLLGAYGIGEALSGLPTRESAKAFCIFASGAMRDIFMVQQGLEILSDDSASVKGWASSCKRTFPRAALSVFDRACMLIDRNVNLKIIFTDMVNRLYGII